MRHFITAMILVSSLGTQFVSGATPPANWDSSRYILVDEVKPEMEAYCLTVFEGDKVERFPLKILSVVKQANPARHMILVIGTDERFKHVGSVHGCSGSPVYIDGRMAGALAAGWDGSIDPLYLVTPIEYMLAIGEGKEKPVTQANTTSYVELAAPLNLDAIAEKAMADWARTTSNNPKMPLVTNLSPQACSQLSETFASAGWMPLQAGDLAQSGDSSQMKSTFEPGGVLILPLCSGDIRMAVTGTVTEVVGDKVYGFGHPFNGIGAVELPMAAGKIHTVIATRDSSFKLGSAGEVAGTLRYDQECGVVGYAGPIPKLIDITVNVKRFDDPQNRTLRCKVVRDRSLTPRVLRSVVIGAALFQGDLPQEHAVSYHYNVLLENGRTIEFKGISSGNSVAAPAAELMSLAAALMNNPFQQMPPDKITLDIEITPKNLAVSLWDARLSDNVVKPGQTVTIQAALKGFRSEPIPFTIELPIPQDCPDGKYQLQILGSDAYQSFLSKTAPQRFTAVDAQSLLDGFNRILNIPQDRLYACLAISQSGLAVRNTELPNLPATKMMVLADAKRIQPISPYTNFIETSIQTGLIASGSASIEFTVDKNK
ncbi:MAG TPA: SpoIVB peptidase S55 domain-containing protein [Anaerohalosphaeraceae bacterium]|nr:SpoIVB peptidase S55 domain-containing protein [Anaerohalosphaeraceae bacterium]